MFKKLLTLIIRAVNPKDLLIYILYILIDLIINLIWKIKWNKLVDNNNKYQLSHFVNEWFGIYQNVYKTKGLSGVYRFYRRTLDTIWKIKTNRTQKTKGVVLPDSSLDKIINKAKTIAGVLTNVTFSSSTLLILKNIVSTILRLLFIPIIVLSIMTTIYRIIFFSSIFATSLISFNYLNVYNDMDYFPFVLSKIINYINSWFNDMYIKFTTLIGYTQEQKDEPIHSILEDISLFYLNDDVNFKDDLPTESNDHNYIKYIIYGCGATIVLIAGAYYFTYGQEGFYILTQDVKSLYNSAYEYVFGSDKSNGGSDTLDKGKAQERQSFDSIKVETTGSVTPTIANISTENDLSVLGQLSSIGPSNLLGGTYTKDNLTYLKDAMFKIYIERIEEVDPDIAAMCSVEFGSYIKDPQNTPIEDVMSKFNLSRDKSIVAIALVNAARVVMTD